MEPLFRYNPQASRTEAVVLDHDLFDAIQPLQTLPWRATALRSQEKFLAAAQPLPLHPQDWDHLRRLEAPYYEAWSKLTKAPRTVMLYDALFAGEAGARWWQVVADGGRWAQTVRLWAKAHDLYQTKEQRAVVWRVVARDLTFAVQSTARWRQFVAGRSPMAHLNSLVAHPNDFFSVSLTPAPPYPLTAAGRREALGRLSWRAYPPGWRQILTEVSAELAERSFLHNRQTPLRWAWLVDNRRWRGWSGGWLRLAVRVKRALAEATDSAWREILQLYWHDSLAGLGKVLEYSALTAPAERDSFVNRLNALHAVPHLGQSTPQLLARANLLMRGVGLRSATDLATDIVEAIPTSLAKRAQRLAKATNIEPASARGLTPLRAQRLMNELGILCLGPDWAREGWRVELGQSGPMTWRVNSREHAVIIPTTVAKTSVRETFATMVHELTHVWQEHNRQRLLQTGPKLLKGDRPVQSDVLLEAGALWMENCFRQAVGDAVRPPEPYHWLALAAKQTGGDFTAAVTAIEKTGVPVDFAFTRALRLFRPFTPLTDKSGSIEESDQLKYLESEVVLRLLRQHKLMGLLMIGGVDLETWPHLSRLGLLNVAKIPMLPLELILRELTPHLK